MLSATVQELIDVVERLDIAVDTDDLAAVLRVRETLLAKSMAPLRAFDNAQLYQLSKARSTKQFLERRVGLTAGDAGATASLARKLGAMPLTEARWVAGTLASGQVRAIAAYVSPRLADHYRAVESDVVDIVAPLTPTETAAAMASWANHAHALADNDNDKAPRDDEFFHSKTLGDRYLSKGSFAALTGANIAKAIELAEADARRDGDTRSPAQRRAEAIADVCGFYIDYRTRTDNDPDAPAVPKTRHLAHLVAIATTNELEDRRGATLHDGTRLDHQAIETLSCTAQLLRLVLDEHGAIRNYQLMPASVTDALFGAVAARDQHCRWPGCRRKAIHTDLHHVTQRQHGGKNSPDNCCLLCKYHHHRGAHDPHTKLHLAPDGTLTITHPDGTTETTKPPMQLPQLPHAA